MEDEKSIIEKNEKVITAVIIIVVILFLAVIGGMKIYDPEKSLKTLWIIFGIVAVIGVVSAIGINSHNVFKRAEKNEDESPKVISWEKIHEIIEKIAHNHYKNNIKLEKGIEPIGTKTVRKDQIYAYKVNMNLDDENFIIIINVSHPEIEPSLLSGEASQTTINTSMNNKAMNPIEDPDTETTEERNPLLGTERTIVKKTHNPKKEDKKPKEDLV